MFGRAVSLSAALRSRHALSMAPRCMSIHVSELERESTPEAEQRSFHRGETPDSEDQYVQHPDVGALSMSERRWVFLSARQRCRLKPASPLKASVFSLIYRFGLQNYDRQDAPSRPCGRNRSGEAAVAHLSPPTPLRHAPPSTFLACCGFLPPANMLSPT